MKIVSKEIELLCWFDRQGVPNPIRFRIVNEEGQEQVIKVDRILKREMEKLAGNKMLVYTCQSQINGELRLLTIKYELDSCKWILFKI